MCADLAEVMKVTLLIPMAAVTNYYKLGGLQEHTFILSLLWRLEVRNQFHWPSSAASRAVGEVLFLASLVAVDSPWLVASSLQSLPLWSHHFFVFCM